MITLYPFNSSPITFAGDQISNISAQNNLVQVTLKDNTYYLGEFIRFN